MLFLIRLVFRPGLAPSINAMCARVCVLMLLLLAHQTSSAQTETPPPHEIHRVLFVGNSYTYFNSMPRQFKAMVEHQMPGHRVETKFIGGGGATLERHWEVGIALDEIRSGAWDHVILQGQSMLGSSDLTDPDSPQQFYKYARMFDQEIKASGATTVFYLTWSRQNQPEMQRYLTHAYLTIADELDSVVAPVGTVWDELRGQPGLDLYDPDGSHPSMVGSYVAAATFATALFDMPLQGLPGRLVGREILRGGILADEDTQLSNVPESQLQTLLAALEEVNALVKEGGEAVSN